MPNRNSTDKRRYYVGSPTGATVPHLGHSSCQFYYGFTRWFYDWEMDHDRRATAMPQNKRALLRTPVSSGCLKNETTGPTSRWSIVQHGLSWLNAVLAGVATVCFLCSHRSDTGAKKPGQYSDVCLFLISFAVCRSSFVVRRPSTFSLQRLHLSEKRKIPLISHSVNWNLTKLYRIDNLALVY